MRSSNRVAAWLIGLCWALAAQAATDCAREKLEPGERLQSYLYDYGQDCTSEAIAAQLKAWSIVDSSDAKVQNANLQNMRAAWEAIGKALGALEADAGSSPRMKAVAKPMSERAVASKTALEQAIAREQAPNVVVFRRAGWQITRRQMALVAFDSPKLPEISVGDLNADCATPDSALCAGTIKAGRTLMLQWRLADTIAAIASQPILDLAASQIAGKEALWNKYLSD